MVIETHNLTKTFNGSTVAVTGLDLAVAPGAVYGLIGRNGAGKTTTLRLLMGLLRPDSGWARVLGQDMWFAPRRVRQKVAYVSQAQQLPGWMSVDDFCRQHAYYYDHWDREFAAKLARRWDLPRNKPVGRLSGGQQRQVALLLALAARPELLLLDEPAAGLDPISRRGLLTGMVEALSGGVGCTILFSTHLITDLERVADQVGMMDRGRLVTSVVLADLLETTKRVQVVFDAPMPPADFAIPGALVTRTAGPVVTAIAKLESDTQFDAVRQKPGLRLNIFPMNLEEIFIELLSRRGEGDLAEEQTETVPGLLVLSREEEFTE
jgi:ABC-2 type transport system ATP-binding protein